MGYHMDGYLIYELDTEPEAQTMLGAINSMAGQYWIDQGYTVTNGELIGKKNGVDNPAAAHTITWDEIKQSPDDTFYFSSLSNDAKFQNGTQQLIDAGFVFIEKEFPIAWQPDPEF